MDNCENISNHCVLLMGRQETWYTFTILRVCVATECTRMRVKHRGGECGAQDRADGKTPLRHMTSCPPSVCAIKHRHNDTSDQGDRTSVRARTPLVCLECEPARARARAHHKRIRDIISGREAFLPRRVLSTMCIFYTRVQRTRENNDLGIGRYTHAPHCIRRQSI